MNKFKHALGLGVEDIVTGFQGIIMSRTEHLTGCNTYGVLPIGVTADGKLKEYQWFDEMRLISCKTLHDVNIPKLSDKEDPGAGKNPPVSNKHHG